MSVAARLPAGNKSGTFHRRLTSVCQRASHTSHQTIRENSSKTAAAAAQSPSQTHSQINTAARNLKHIQVCLGWSFFFVGGGGEGWGRLDLGHWGCFYTCLAPDVKTTAFFLFFKKNIYVHIFRSLHDFSAFAHALLTLRPFHMPQH